MNVLSLFAGIGGIELGLERAGMTVVGQVELDPFCRSILEKHWPDVPQHDDVRTAVEWWTNGPRPPVDVICGGFPCQPFSTAGLQRGASDKRHLWPDMLRIVREGAVTGANGAPADETAAYNLWPFAFDYVRSKYLAHHVALAFTPIVEECKRIHKQVLRGRVWVALHMHAGDGNVHTNIPVNSDNYAMLQTAHEAVARIMALARRLGGVISGEHGIGITKLEFLSDEEIAEALQAAFARLSAEVKRNTVVLVGFQAEQTAADHGHVTVTVGVLDHRGGVVERAEPEDPGDQSLVVHPQAVDRREEGTAAGGDDEFVVAHDGAVIGEHRLGVAVDAHHAHPGP